MKNEGFEVKVTRQDGSTYDRPVNNIADGEGWAKNYVDSQGFSPAKEATVYIDGKPHVTFHGK